MDTLTLTTTTITDTCSIQFFSQRIFHLKKLGFLTFPRNKSRKHLVFASKDEPQLDDWDKMELKFGRMIGEDPKLTLAKIMGRKSNPDISYLEIEKLFDKKKSKTLNEDVEEIPFDMSDETKPTKSMLGLNLVRPVPKKGIKFEATNKPVEPVSESKSSTPPVNKDKKERRSSVPDVILRKPSLFSEDDDENKKFSMFGMKPNLSLKMGKEPQKERFSDITLLKKPEPIASNPGLEEEKSHSDSTDDKSRDVYETEGSQKYGTGAAPLLQKPELRKLNFTEEADQYSSKEQTEFRSSNLMDDNMIEDVSHSDNQLVTATGGNSNQFQETKQKESSLDKGLATELQGDMWSVGETSTSDGTSERNSALYMETVLKVKPKRLDPSTTNQKTREVENPESLGNNSELDNFLTTLPIKEREDDDWARAEELVKARERGEVEIISASTRGFVVSFGSLIGFLPYRNLAARWKFLAFESWLRRRGLDPSAYRQNLGIIGKYEASSMIDTSESVADSEIDSKTSEAITSDMKLEDLLMIYDQEKLKFLLSFVGQKVRVGVVLADRNSRKLIFSIKPKEKEELVEKKRSLMAQLSVGDVVKCCIKKITYFGVFVELEGVPALIHQSEVSWDATLDPASYFKVGQIVDAKVHQLDFSMERIFLSLKEITPDPLLEALEAVVGDHEPLDGRLEAAQADSEWPDVESLIKELEQYDGIQSVSKGRYFLSPGLAPTFQVYMASMFENQYKLLARAGNKVQEVIVQTSLSKDDLKSAILTCTNRVE